jgi:ketosteroid isomerase-like protein
MHGANHQGVIVSDDRLAELERRLQRLEDERAIERLIASYGPLVDAGESEAVADLWTTDGVYDVEGWLMSSRDDVAAMVRSNDHQGLIRRGSAHFLGPAVVTVDGDEAVAVCESLLVVRRDDGYIVWRAGANHFQLRRIDQRWQIVNRVTRPLDGRAEARELLADGVAGRTR